MASKLFGDKQPAIPGLVQSGGGLSGELFKLRADVEAAFKEQEDDGGYIITEEFTNLAAASTNGLKTAAASASTIQTFLRSSGHFDGASAATEMVPPRNVTVTTSTHANIDAVAVVVTGRVRDAYGKLIAQTDTITTTDGGGVTNAGTKAFAFVDSVVIPAQSGTGGTVAIGFGVLVGLKRKIRTLAGLTQPLREIAAGSIVTNGTFATPAASAPHGTYSPSTAANGTNDYAITYIVAA